MRNDNYKPNHEESDVPEINNSELSELIVELTKKLNDLADDHNECAVFLAKWLEGKSNISNLLIVFDSNKTNDKFKMVGEVLLKVIESWPVDLKNEENQLQISQARHLVLECFPNN